MYRFEFKTYLYNTYRCIVAVLWLTSDSKSTISSQFPNRTNWATTNSIFERIWSLWLQQSKYFSCHSLLTVQISQITFEPDKLFSISPKEQMFSFSHGLGAQVCKISLIKPEYSTIFLLIKNRFSTIQHSWWKVLCLFYRVPGVFGKSPQDIRYIFFYSYNRRSGWFVISTTNTIITLLTIDLWSPMQDISTWKVMMIDL